jgi:hypothetical protein
MANLIDVNMLAPASQDSTIQNADLFAQTFTANSNVRQNERLLDRAENRLENLKEKLRNAISALARAQASDLLDVNRQARISEAQVRVTKLDPQINAIEAAREAYTALFNDEGNALEGVSEESISAAENALRAAL